MECDLHNSIIKLIDNDKDYLEYKHYEDYEECKQELLLNILKLHAVNDFYIISNNKVYKIRKNDNIYSYDICCVYNVNKKVVDNVLKDITLYYIYMLSFDKKIYNTFEECKNVILLNVL
jgi:hypothetical protein